MEEATPSGIRRAPITQKLMRTAKRTGKRWKKPADRERNIKAVKKNIPTKEMERSMI